MGIQDWSEDIIVVDLSGRLEQHDELQTAVEMVRQRGDCNVVVDFSHVDVIASTTLARLLELRQLLDDGAHKLVLCGVAPATRGVFATSRLDSIFEFANDRFTALASLQMVG